MKSIYHQGGKCLAFILASCTLYSPYLLHFELMQMIIQNQLLGVRDSEVEHCDFGRFLDGFEKESRTPWQEHLFQSSLLHVGGFPPALPCLELLFASSMRYNTEVCEIQTIDN